MKTLSHLQPWASLTALGHKQIETRGFRRSHRGPLLIHASKPPAQIDRLGGDFARHYHDAGMWDLELPLGAIIGMVTMTDVVGTDWLSDWLTPKASGHTLPLEYTDAYDFVQRIPQKERELAFGDYSAGRYGWLLTDPIAFQTPVPARGQLGLWEPPAAIMARVQEQIEIAKAKTT